MSIRRRLPSGITWIHSNTTKLPFTEGPALSRTCHPKQFVDTPPQWQVSTVEREEVVGEEKEDIKEELSEKEENMTI